MVYADKKIFHTYLTLIIKKKDEPYYSITPEEDGMYLKYRVNYEQEYLLNYIISNESGKLCEILNVEHSIEDEIGSIYHYLKIGYSKNQLISQNLTEKQIVEYSAYYMRMILGEKLIYPSFNRKSIFYNDSNGEKINIMYSPLLFIKKEKIKSISNETKEFLRKLIKYIKIPFIIENVRGGMRVSFRGTPIIHNAVIEKCNEYIINSEYYTSNKVEYYKDVDFENPYIKMLTQAAYENRNPFNDNIDMNNEEYKNNF